MESKVLALESFTYVNLSFEFCNKCILFALEISSTMLNKIYYGHFPVYVATWRENSGLSLN